MRLRMGKVQAPDGLTGYGHAALVLLVTWWMYDGFASTTATRLPMLLGQAAFRRTLGTGPVGVLLVAAVVALALAPLGVFVAGFAQLMGLAVVGAGAATLLVRRHSPVAA